MSRAAHLLVPVVVLGFAACAGADEIPTGMPAGKVSVHWQPAAPLEGDLKVELGAASELRLWMRTAADLTATPPNVETAFAGVKGVEVRPVAPARTFERTVDGVRERYFVRPYEVLWFRLGKQTLPELEVTAKPVDDPAQGESEAEADAALTAKTEPLEFEVKPVLASDASQNAEIPGSLIADPPPRPWWPWIVGAGGLAALVALFLLWRRRRQRRPISKEAAVFVPPDQIALARIKELERMLRDGQIGGERLVVEVSDALRRWLHRGLHLHALDRTTEEFLHDLGSGTRLPVALRNTLTAFLEQGDLVKFAAQRPNLEQCLSMLQIARDFVQQTREAHEGQLQSAAAPPAVAAAAEQRHG